MGLYLRKSGKTQGTVYVKKILPGGAAEADGRLQLKDEVNQVNGSNVSHLSLEEVFLHPNVSSPPARSAPLPFFPPGLPTDT